jgi:hypothetical protein
MFSENPLSFLLCAVLLLGWLHLFEKFADTYDGPAYGAAANFLRVVAGGYAQGVEAAVEGFEHGFCPDVGADSAGGAVLDVDRCADCDFIAFAVRLQRVEGRDFHEANHVGRGIYRREPGVVRGQRVFEFYGFFGLAAGADGDGFGHSLYGKTTTGPKGRSPLGSYAALKGCSSTPLHAFHAAPRRSSTRVYEFVQLTRALKGKGR